MDCEYWNLPSCITKFSWKWKIEQASWKQQHQHWKDTKPKSSLEQFALVPVHLLLLFRLFHYLYNTCFLFNGCKKTILVIWMVAFTSAGTRSLAAVATTTWYRVRFQTSKSMIQAGFHDTRSVYHAVVDQCLQGIQSLGDHLFYPSSSPNKNFRLASSPINHFFRIRIFIYDSIFLPRWGVSLKRGLYRSNFTLWFINNTSFWRREEKIGWSSLASCQKIG